MKVLRDVWYDCVIVYIGCVDMFIFGFLGIGFGLYMFVWGFNVGM